MKDERIRAICGVILAGMAIWFSLHDNYPRATYYLVLGLYFLNSVADRPNGR